MLRHGFVSFFFPSFRLPLPFMVSHWQVGDAAVSALGEHAKSSMGQLHTVDLQDCIKVAHVCKEPCGG